MITRTYFFLHHYEAFELCYAVMKQCYPPDTAPQPVISFVFFGCGRPDVRTPSAKLMTTPPMHSVYSDLSFFYVILRESKVWKNAVRGENNCRKWNSRKTRNGKKGVINDLFSSDHYFYLKFVLYCIVRF